MLFYFYILTPQIINFCKFFHLTLYSWIHLLNVFICMAEVQREIVGSAMHHFLSWKAHSHCWLKALVKLAVMAREHCLDFWDENVSNIPQMSTEGRIEPSENLPWTIVSLPHRLRKTLFSYCRVPEHSLILSSYKFSLL